MFRITIRIRVCTELCTGRGVNTLIWYEILVKRIASTFKFWVRIPVGTVSVRSQWQLFQKWVSPVSGTWAWTSAEPDLLSSALRWGCASCADRTQAASASRTCRYHVTQTRRIQGGCRRCQSRRLCPNVRGCCWLSCRCSYRTVLYLHQGNLSQWY